MKTRLLTVLILCYVTIATAAGAKSISFNGDIRIIDGGIIFPDSSVQTTATLQGPVGPQGPKGETGSVGPQGPAGAYVKTVVVSPAGSDLENGSALLSALAGVSASAASPALVKIEPGNYDLNGNTLVMKPYLDIQGSGENTTVIMSAIGSSTDGVVNGANNTEIRFLTIKNTGTGSPSIALINNSASPRLTNVTVAAMGSGAANYGISNAAASSPVMKNVTVISSGAESDNIGVYNQSSSPTMTNVTITATGGSGSCIGILNAFSSPTIKSSAATCSGSSYTNNGIRNTAFSSPIISETTVTGTGGLYSSGITNFQSSPVLTNVIASASDAIHSNWGVYLDDSTPTINNITATASGGLYAVGTEVVNTSLNMSNVISKGSGATNNYGLRTLAYSGSFTVSIDRSTFEGSSNSIFNNNFFTVHVGGSKLAGGDVNPIGSYSCTYSYMADYTPLANDCQRVQP